MGAKGGALLALAALAGFVWWLTRPAPSGTKINAVAGLRG